jgi:hypothetical protein
MGISQSGKGRTPARTAFVKCFVERLCEHCQAFRFGFLHSKSRSNTTIVLTHLSKLCSDFTGELYTVLYRWIWFEGFALDFLEKIRSGSQELVV